VVEITRRCSIDVPRCHSATLEFISFVVRMISIEVSRIVSITVEEAGQSSREIISHASLFSLIGLVRAYIHAKIPSVRLLPHTKHLTRCEDKARELTITCDIKWSPVVSLKRRDRLFDFYKIHLFTP